MTETQSKSGAKLSDLTWYSVKLINPEPWVASEGSVGRKNGKVFIHFHKPIQLRNYQEAVAEEFRIQNELQPEGTPLLRDWLGTTAPLEVQFFFWRELAVGEGIGRKVRAHVADATNLQKALEDALQGILYKNDRQIRSVTSTIVSQNAETTPFILVGIREHSASSLVGPTIQRSSLDTDAQAYAENTYPAGQDISELF